MREKTYEKLEKYAGYIGTEQLLKDGFTNRQIACFVEEQFLERICHGYYWVTKSPCEKPEAYKAIEVCLSDPRAVICADSACFYLGLIKEEPGKLSVATSRNDRSGIRVAFPVKRHYFSQSDFFQSSRKITSDFGDYNIFDIDRSVCDCIRLKKDIDAGIFEQIIDNYRNLEYRQEKRMQEYAKRLRILTEIKRYFEL